MDQLGLKGAKAVATPGTKEEGTTTNDCEQELEPEQASLYRAITARCNYISPDRPDISYTVKELARRMSKPTRGDWLKLKRLGRYLVGQPRLQQTYQWQSIQSTIKVFTDADWAGCRETRKSTTGGCAVLGKHTLKGWSKTQSLIALSSGESELYAALRASSEALGIMALLQDLGYQVKGEIWGDASAALGIINRKGLGKTRHIQTGLFWIKQTAADQRLQYGKALGKENPADLFIKFLDATTTNAHVQRLEYRFIQGRSSEAPKLHVMSQSMDKYSCGNTMEQCEWVQMMLNNVNNCRSRRADDSHGKREPRSKSNAMFDDQVKLFGNIQHRSRIRNGFGLNIWSTSITNIDMGGTIDDLARQHKGFQCNTVQIKDKTITECAPSDVQTNNGMQQLIESYYSMEQLDVTASLRNNSSAVNWKQPTNQRESGLGQSVLQGYTRQVQGYNGSNSAQPERPWGSTQTLPARHNKAQRPCQDGHAVIQA